MVEDLEYYNEGRVPNFQIFNFVDTNIDGAIAISTSGLYVSQSREVVSLGGMTGNRNTGVQHMRGVIFDPLSFNNNFISVMRDVTEEGSMHYATYKTVLTLERAVEMDSGDGTLVTKQIYCAVCLVKKYEEF